MPSFWQVFEPWWAREQVAANQCQCKRAIIESVNDYLKNVCQIEHTRHRSPYNSLVHLLAGLAAYCHQPKKPSLHLERDHELLAAR